MHNFTHKALLALFLLARISAFAQQPDFFYLRPNVEDEYQFVGSFALEIKSDDGEDSYLVAFCNYVGDWYTEELTSVYPAKVVRLSSQGEWMGELTLGEPGRRTVINGLYHDPDTPGHVIAAGKIHNNDGHFDQPFLAKFDHNLNLVWQKEIEMPEPYRKFYYRQRVMMDSRGNIVYCTSPYEKSTSGSGPASFYTPLLYFRLSKEGELLTLFETPEVYRFMDIPYGHLFEYADGSGDYGQTLMPNYTTTIRRMDRNFGMVSTLSLPLNEVVSNSPLTLLTWNGGTNDVVAYSCSDGSMILACGSDLDVFGTGSFKTIIALAKIDTAGNISNYSMLGLAGEHHCKFAYNPAMVFDGKTAFVCGFSVEYNDDVDKPYIVVAKADENANVVWERYYYEENRAFLTYSIMATSDGGCLVTGHTGVYGVDSADAFALKFFADGSVSVPELEEFARPYAYWPNPAKDELHLQYSPDVKPAQAELFDLQGRLVRQQRTGLETLSLEGLAPGTYTLRVTLEGGRTFADKVVKE